MAIWPCTKAVSLTPRRFSSGAANQTLKANNPDVAATKFAGLAYAQLSRGQNAAAIAAAEQGAGEQQRPGRALPGARILVEAGQPATAQATAASLASELATEPQAYGKILAGEIALKNRDLPQAIKLLTEANSVVDTWIGHFDLGRAYLEGGAFAQADSEFDRCIKRRGEALLVVDDEPTYGYFPPVYYYLGRAREGLQTAGYADVYREYLKIRGNSTAGSAGARCATPGRRRIRRAAKNHRKKSRATSSPCSLSFGPAVTTSSSYSP